MSDSTCEHRYVVPDVRSLPNLQRHGTWLTVRAVCGAVCRDCGEDLGHVPLLFDVTFTIPRREDRLQA